MTRPDPIRRPSAAAHRRWPLLPLLAMLTVTAAAATPDTGALRSSHPAVQVAAGKAAVAPDTAVDAAPGVDVQPALLAAIKAGGRSDYVIELRERADLSAAAGMDWDARGHHVVEQLRSTAERSQAALRRELSAAGVAFEPHWIKNVILVRAGDAASLRLAAGHPAVARIRELPRAEIIRPEPGKPLRRKAGEAGIGIADNIAWIGADDAWAQGTRGNGVTVGVIDTGAFHTHDALRRQYRGWLGGDSYEHDYNWFFPHLLYDAPSSESPHGTHVIGTILGDDHDPDPAARNRIGVAPGAQWIACVGLTEDGDNAGSLLSCGEFMLAPTRTDGSAPDPDRRPQVVNNSWGENTCNGEATGFYAEVVDAWIAAGIFPVFAAGNTSGCGLDQGALSTVSSPASLAAAFAVGSTGNHDGLYASHSLWGPTADASPGLPALPDHRGHPQLKPQVVAPGVDIVSALDWSNDDYGTMTGTSMSAPHIAGLVALMLEAGECLVGDYPTLGSLIMATARPLPYASGGEPAPGPGDVPNYATGWGEIDAAAAVDAAAAACGPQGFIAGQVTGPGGAPVAGARVELFVDENVRVWDLTTEPDGRYIRRLPEQLAGGYTLRISAYGFVRHVEAGLTVADDATTTRDVQLTAAPRVTVQGVVVDAATGWPLHARLRISGYPDGAVWTDLVDGRYAVELPSGASYRIDVDSDIPGYLPRTLDLAVVAAQQQDIALSADPVRCEAPGYTYARHWLAEDFEAGTPPSGWTASSAGQGWQFGTHAELDRPDYWPIPARDGRFVATIDFANEDVRNDARFDYLVSPPIDLTTATAPALRFASLFFSGAFLSKGAYVQASIDDGATWSAVGVPGQSMQWRDEALSLAAFAGHTVRLRFHYDDQSTDDEDFVNPGWAVDDVAVVGGCSAPAAGSLVVGHVRDGNTAEPLDGAEVAIGPLTATTRGSDDPAVGAGFFAVHAAPGSTTVTARRGTQPEGYGEASAAIAVVDGRTLAAELALPAGRLVFDPATGPQATLELGTTLEQPFTLRNDGGLPLAYAFEGQSIEQHFEEAIPPAGWTASDSGGCPWSVTVFGNSAGGDGQAAGVYPYDCWEQGPVDSTLQLPPIDLSASAHASLGFFLALHQGPGSDSRFDVEASTDGGTAWTPIYTRTENTTGFEPAFLVEHDLSAFAGQADLRLRFRYRSTPPWGDVQIDQVHVFRELGIDDPLAITPAPGVLAAGQTVIATARFDATRVAQPGVHPIAIRVAEDTPYAYPYGDLVGTMTVTAPASFGSVAGTLRSLGRCEAEPAPLAELPLSIRAADGSTFAIRTDADGHYRYWLDAARGPYTVQVAADDHVAVAVPASVTAGTETQLDIDLRPDAACIVPEPVTLEIAVPRYASTAKPFDLLNLGAAAGDYSARIGGDPTLPSALRISQNSVAEPEPFASVGCFNPATGFALETHWYRVMTLADRGLAGSTAWVDGVHFGAESATSTAGSQSVQVTLYRLDGALALDTLTLLARTDAVVADTPLGLLDAAFDAPVEVPLDATLVVEIAIGDGRDAGSNFYPAGNTAPDSAPAYFMAPECGLDQPTSYDELGFDGLSPIIDLDIRASDACGEQATPVAWLGVTPPNGSVAGDDAATLQATVNARRLTTGSRQAALCIATPGPSDRDAHLPVQLEVGAPSPGHIFIDGFD